jgi:SAM-dependent methyltransferase
MIDRLNYENYQTEYAKFWDEIDDVFAHRELTGYLISEEHIFQKRREDFLDLIVWEDQVVLDYGCGGGFLGKQLFLEKNIKQYVGLDISYNSCLAATNTLQRFNKNRWYIGKTDSLREWMHYISYPAKIDIFVSMAVIHHFPTPEYLNEFLETLNSMNINLILLAIRADPKRTYFNVNNPGNSCFTNQQYISNKLTNYILNYESDINPKDFGQYLIYRPKTNDIRI